MTSQTRVLLARHSSLFTLHSSLDFFMDRMVPARGAELLDLQPVLILLLVLRRRVVAVLAIAAL